MQNISSNWAAKEPEWSHGHLRSEGEYALLAGEKDPGRKGGGGSVKTERESGGSVSLSVLNSSGWKKAALLTRRERGKTTVAVVFVVLVCMFALMERVARNSTEFTNGPFATSKQKNSNWREFLKFPGVSKRCGRGEVKKEGTRDHSLF